MSFKVLTLEVFGVLAPFGLSLLRFVLELDSIFEGVGLGLGLGVVGGFVVLVFLGCWGVGVGQQGGWCSSFLSWSIRECVWIGGLYVQCFVGWWVLVGQHECGSRACVPSMLWSVWGCVVLGGICGLWRGFGMVLL